MKYRRTETLEMILLHLRQPYRSERLSVNTWIYHNWDIFTDWLGYEPDIRVHRVWDDIQ